MKTIRKDFKMEISDMKRNLQSSLQYLGETAEITIDVLRERSDEELEASLKDILARAKSRTMEELMEKK